MSSGYLAAFHEGRIRRERLDQYLDHCGLRPYVRTYEEPLLLKDLAVARIVEREYGRRPLYVALTVPDQMGLERRLVQRGIVMKVEETGQPERVDVEDSLRLLDGVYRYRGVLRDGRTDHQIHKDDNATRLVQNYAAAYLTVAQTLVSSGRRDEAIEVALRAREISPRAPAVHYSLGILYRQKRDFPAMEAEFRWMVETGNADSRIHALLAESCELQGKTAEAVATYRSALTLFPEDWDLHRGLFQCLAESAGDLVGAIEVLNLWLDRHPDDTAVRRARDAYADSLGRMKAS
jgi:tetratricopeptide (TPR) repeat protein